VPLLRAGFNLPGVFADLLSEDLDYFRRTLDGRVNHPVDGVLHGATVNVEIDLLAGELTGFVEVGARDVGLEVEVFEFIHLHMFAVADRADDFTSNPDAVSTMRILIPFLEGVYACEMALAVDDYVKNALFHASDRDTASRIPSAGFWLNPLAQTPCIAQT